MINRQTLVLFGIVLALVLATAYLIPQFRDPVPEPWTAPGNERSQRAGAKPARPAGPALIREEVKVGRWMRGLMRDSGFFVDGPVEGDNPRSESSGCTLVGKLIWQDKPWAPLKEVTVGVTDVWLDTILPSEKREARAPVLLPPETKTDEWGRFLLRQVPTHRTLFLVVRAGDLTLHVQKLSYLPFPGQTLNLYEIGVPERGSLSGVVVGPDGKPIHNIRVRAVHDVYGAGRFEDTHESGRRAAEAAGFRSRGLAGTTQIPGWVRERDRLLPFPSTRTDRKGRFTLNGVKVGRTTLLLQDKQHSVVVTDNIVVVGKVTDLGTLVATTGHTLGGRIVIKGPDQEYQPVPRVLVSVLPRGWPRGLQAVRTNRKGQFKVAGLPTDKAVVYARRPDSRIWEQAHKHGGDYVLGPRTTCAVQVLDPDGNPVRDADLALSYHERRFTHRDVDCSAHVKQDLAHPGRFTLLRIPYRRELRLLATAPGFGPGVYKLTQPEQINIYLARAQRLRVHVRGVEDKPLAGADVFVSFRRGPDREPGTHTPGRDYQLLSYKPMRLGTTDKDGWLVLENLWEGPMSFRARYPGYAMKSTPWVTPGPEEPIAIRMQQAARLEGKLTLDGRVPRQPWVILAMDGGLVTGTDGKLIPERLGALRRTLTAPDGSFYFNELPEGRWSLRVARPNTAQRLLGQMSVPEFRAWPDLEQDVVDVFAGQTVFHEMKVRLDRASSFQVVGTVLANSKPLGGVVVRALPAALKGQLSEVLARLEEIRKLMGDRETPQETRRALRKESGHLERKSTRLARLRARRGRAPGLVPPSPGAGALTETDSKGRYTLWLPDWGRYRIWAETHDRHGRQILATESLIIKKPEAEQKPAQQQDTKATPAKPEPRKPARVDLVVHTGSLIVTLTKHTGHRIGGRMFRILRLNKNNMTTGVVLRARANHEGEIHLRQVPAGRYRLELEGHAAGNPVIERGLFDVKPGTLNLHHARSRPRNWNR